MIPPTEERNPRTKDLDVLSARAGIDLMDAEDRRAFDAVHLAGAELAAAAERVAASYAAGGRIVYLGAGTSGHIARMDAMEIPSTFGVEPGRFSALLAGGRLDASCITTSEDDEVAAARALDAAAIGDTDTVIGISASGVTPFVVAGVAHARHLGAHTCGIANNPETPLLQVSLLPIFLDTGPEVVTGSTRLKAGTAQKLALNRISTMAMVLAGRVVSNLMIEVGHSTEKLRQRGMRILQELAGVDADTASVHLEKAGWSVRTALDSLELCRDDETNR